eukprot:TRINITY_DN1941_c0_g1_i2.p1 TRINITY_DN1941_c0_g1~~TRINITY_DN1941_c0_g1_i2.p1  ORF type:complete len:211 (+),score=12.31 TRINITY_DN1941_c0_g1_i2:29-634(+)
MSHQGDESQLNSPSNDYPSAPPPPTSQSGDSGMDQILALLNQMSERINALEESRAPTVTNVVPPLSTDTSQDLEGLATPGSTSTTSPGSVPTASPESASTAPPEGASTTAPSEGANLPAMPLPPRDLTGQGTPHLLRTPGYHHYSPQVISEFNDTNRDPQGFQEVGFLASERANLSTLGRTPIYLSESVSPDGLDTPSVRN